jgi:hypothetical protein
MAYRTWKPGERERSKAPCILIYSDPGVGKSTTPLVSLPQPILWLALEDLDPELALDAISKPVDVTFADVDDVDDILDFLGEQLLELNKGNFPYRSIGFDGASYTMIVLMRIKAEDQTKAAGTFQKDVKVGQTTVKQFSREFIDSTKLDPAAWGAFASKMFRITRSLKLFSKAGIPAVMTALLDKDVKWDNSGKFVAGPLFGGKEFPRSVSGFFDLIGLMEPNIQNGTIVYPPIVKFGPPNSGFVCKWTGPEMKSPVGPLDFGKILQVFNRGKVE